MFSCTQKALVNYERHLSDIRKIPTLEKIYHHLSETWSYNVFFIMWYRNTCALSGWVSGSTPNPHSSY